MMVFSTMFSVLSQGLLSAFSIIILLLTILYSIALIVMVIMKRSLQAFWCLLIYIINLIIIFISDKEGTFYYTTSILNIALSFILVNLTPKKNKYCAVK